MVKEIMKLFVACGIIGGISIAPGMIKTEKVVEPNLDLPTVGTVEKLKELVKKADDNNYSGGRYYLTDDMVMFNSIKSADLAMPESSKSENSINDDYSTTNVQVEGVDEADIIKNDGKYKNIEDLKNTVISYKAGSDSALQSCPGSSRPW